MDINVTVLEILRNSGKAMKISDLVKSGGIEKKEVEKAIKSLKAQDLIYSPQKCFWQIK